MSYITCTMGNSTWVRLEDYRSLEKKFVELEERDELLRKLFFKKSSKASISEEEINAKITALEDDKTRLIKDFLIQHNVKCALKKEISELEDKIIRIREALYVPCKIEREQS